ncbi:MAG: DUF4197 domain-containing protein [Saprospiraceae bacterium]
MKNLGVLFLVLSLVACTPQEINSVLGTVMGGELTSAEVGSGLKEALNIGISKGADRLSSTDGYFKSAYKILLPAEAQKVTEKLRVIPGFENIENEILKKINRGAEDAAKKAKPIFVNAIKKMTFTDAMNILMGADNSATTYLNNATYNQLRSEFSPVIIQSLDKFQARKYWGDLVNKYNQIPFVKKLNPSLEEHVTQMALKGLFTMVEKKEVSIRNNVSERTSSLLKKVFAKQDNK